jgi:hypothetical protein
MARKAELAELQAMIDRLGDNDPSPADKSQLITSLAFAGENKIGLFAAMRQITKDAQA